MFAQESVMDIQKEREAFEKEMLDSGYVAGNISAFWDEKNQNYDIAITELRMAWHAWKSAKDQAVPKWISVKDNLPPANILVLGMSQTRSNIFNIYNVMALDEFEEADVTHWMPLPDAPQEPTND